MKKSLMISVLALLPLLSCVREKPGASDDPLAPLTRGLMQVVVESNDGAGAERIRTIRLMVFTDMASVPRAEKNVFYHENDFTGLQLSQDNGASRVTITLQVGRRVNGSNDKLVVAIVNEPSEMTLTLDAVTAPADLANIELDMSRLLTDDHRSLKPDAAMPMSGAVWTDKIFQTVEQARADRQMISLKRAVARIDVYMNTRLPGGEKIAPNSFVILSNTCTKGCLIRHEDDRGHVLGNIPSTAPGDLTQTSWIAESLLDIPDNGAAHLCSFYTPERNCLMDKPMLEVSITTPDGIVRNKAILLEKACNAQHGEKQIDTIRRNSIYKVTATITASEITAGIMEWNHVPGDYPIPGQYSLTVDKTSLAFPLAGGTQTVAVAVDHPDGWAIDDVTNLPTGIAAVRSGNVVNVTAIPGSAASVGSFAIRAGNLRKTITVTIRP